MALASIIKNGKNFLVTGKVFPVTGKKFSGQQKFFQNFSLKICSESSESSKKLKILEARLLPIQNRSKYLKISLKTSKIWVIGK